MSLDNKVVDLADLKVSHDYLLEQDGLLSDRIDELGSGIDGVESIIGDLSNLSTTLKDSIVSAINEVLQTGGRVKSVNSKTGDVVLKTSDLTNDSGYLTSYTETDPTVPSWAKQVSKPTYTAQEVGASSVEDMNSEVNTRRVADAQLQSQITALGNGAPIPVETVAEMIDNTKAYLYTGAEVGWLTGYWYTYDSAQAKFVPRGEYGVGTVIDNTLTVSGDAADAKATGDAISEVNGRLQEYEEAIGFESNVILSNSDFVNGLWANGTFRTDGAYGKYKSNREQFPITSFRVNVETEDYTDLVISVTCFDVNKAYIANLITNNAAIQSGSYAVAEAGILNARPTTKYIAVAIGKVSGSTYYDLPSDITITVERTADIVTIAERVTAIEAVMGTGASVIVAQNGGGHFTTIQSAVDYITDDSASKPYTIYIKPGIYNEHIHLGGSRYISFVGENRETCIIRSHTGMYTDAPLWLDGNFTIENLTLQMLDDEAPETWTPGTSQSDPATMLPGYALHIDGGAASSPDAVYGYRLGVVRNCTLFSVAFPAIGAGLHSNQKLVFENCDFVRRTSAKYHNAQYQYYTNYNGAMIIHDSTRAADSVNQNLDIIGCRFLCNLGKAATFRFRYGTPANVKYTLIDTTFWSDSDGAVVDAVLNDSVLLGYSHGNNISDFNP